MKINCGCSVPKKLSIVDVPPGTCFKGVVAKKEGVFMRLSYSGSSVYVANLDTGTLHEGYLVENVERVLPEAILNC